MTKRSIGQTGHFVAAAFAILAAFCAPTSAVDVEGETTFLLRAGRVYTMGSAGDEWCIERGEVFVEDGKIAAVGKDLEVPPFVRVIDMPDAVVMPGLVLADSSLAGHHTGEDSVGAQYRAIDAFNPYTNYDRLLAGGVTTAYLSPGGHRLVAGVGAVVKLAAPPNDEVLRPVAELVINLGNRVFNPPAKQHWLLPPSSDLAIEPSEVQRPTSRLGQFLQLRQSFDDAIRYAAARREGDVADRPTFDAATAALAEQLDRKALLRVRADRATDIEQAVAFFGDRKMPFVLTGGLESRRVADILAKAGTPIVYEIPINAASVGGNLGPDPDRIEDRLIIPEALADSPIAIAGPEGAPHADLLLYASVAHRAGLSRRKALEAVTSTAAKILDVDKRVGAIRSGLDADLLILNGEPLAATTSVLRTVVNGRVVFDAAHLVTDALVVKAGKLWTGEQWITDGEVLLENGRIVAAGETAPHPPHARVLDAGPSAWITPGFIDARGHLGLEGDKSTAGADVSIADALFRAGPEFARVARGGVTTVLTSVYKPSSKGARVTAIHTAGDNPGELIVKETAGLILSLRGQDHEAAVTRVRSELKAGKAYDDAWKKYEKALAEYKAKGPEKKPDKKPEKKKEAADVQVEKPEVDPLTGTWNGEISGRPFPEPQEFIAKLKLTGETVEGSVETVFGGGEAVAVTGTFKDKHLSLELDVDIPIGKPTIEADIDPADHMTGTLEIGGRFSFELQAERTEKEAPKITVSRKRKKKSNGGPEAPKRNEALEPYRALFDGRIAMIVDVDSRIVIETILPVFAKEFKVPVVLLNADEAWRLKEIVADSKTGVIVPAVPVRKVNRKDYAAAVDLARAGIPVAFQSDAEDAARHLLTRATGDVRRGMDMTAALRALTGGAARMLRCDDEVGVLKPGRRGDLLIFDGPPLEPSSRIERVIINGKEVRP
jgi:imidazolonepropionase-like amidohydrolase